MKKIFYATVAALAIFVGCKPSTPVVTAEVSLKADASFIDGTANVTVSLSEALTSDVTVTLGLADDSQLKAANVTFAPEAVIAAGKKSAKVEVTFTEGDLAEGEYTATIEVKNAVGANVGEKSKATIAATVEAPYVENFVYKMGLKTNYYFKFAERTTLETFTVEWKVYAESWNTDGMSNRLGCIGDQNEQGVMLRFNDDGGKHVGDEDWGLLQVCNKFTGNFYIGRNSEKYPEAAEGGIACHKWMAKEWHVISISGDGSTLRVYDNGELVAEKAYGDTGLNLDFEYYEQGMSWTDGGEHNSLTGYPYRQQFLGNIAYIRVWEGVRSAEEIKSTLCATKEGTKGLVANWVFDAGKGHVIENKGGKSVYNLDFTKTYYKQNSNEVEVNCAEHAESSWIEMNHCE